MARVICQRLKVDAVAVPHFQRAPDFERNRGLTDRRPAHLQCPREIAFRGQAVTHPQPRDLHVVEQSGGKLLIEPTPVRGTKGLGTRPHGPRAPWHGVASPTPLAASASMILYCR